MSFRMCNRMLPSWYEIVLSILKKKNTKKMNLHFCNRHVNLASTVIVLMIDIKCLLCLYSFQYSHDKGDMLHVFLCFLVAHKQHRYMYEGCYLLAFRKF